MKKNYQIFCLLCFFGLSILQGYTQVCFDTVKLAEIKIEAIRSVPVTGAKNFRIDTLILKTSKTSDIAMILSTTGNMYLKTNGPGLLATTSFRGAGSSHTAVTWNGMSVNNPMLGQVDFSQIPAGFVDEIMISQNSQNEGVSSMAAGIISMESVPHWNQHIGIEAIQRISSFNTRQSFLSFQKLWHKADISARFIRSSADNQYPYRLYASSDSVLHRRNASYATHALMTDIYLKTSKNSVASLKSWIQDYSGEIPSDQNEETQRNQSFRMMGDYKFDLPHTNFKTLAGLSLENTDYRNPYLSMISVSNAKTLTHQSFIKFRKQQTGIEFNYGINHYIVNADAYTHIYRQTHFESSETFRWENNTNLKSRFTVCQHINPQSHTWVNPSAGIEYIPFKGFTLKSAWRKFIHTPTMNDLFWTDSLASGNPDLDNENGWTAESSLAFEMKNAQTKMAIEITGFYSEVKNWILWHSVNGKWKPDNLESVTRKGIEASYHVSSAFSKVTWSISGNTSYVLAINHHNLSANDVSAGKQLIYIPLVQSNHTVLITCQQTIFSVNLTANSRSFTSSDNRYYIPGYALISTFVSRDIRFSFPGYFTLTAGCRNIMNINYMVMAGYPMPGRTFELSIKYLFSKKKDE